MSDNGPLDPEQIMTDLNMAARSVAAASTKLARLTVDLEGDDA